jgi:3-oxoacyl-ACP reductase-like protein
MEFTEEQLKMLKVILEKAIAENNKFLITKEETKHLINVMKGDLPQIDTSKLATKEEVTNALNTLKTELGADIKKLIQKVFPDMPASQKSKWFVFD